MFDVNQYSEAWRPIVVSHKELGYPAVMNPTATQYPQLYHQLIDDQTWQFVQATEQASPPELASLPIEAQRRSYVELSQLFATPIPDTVTKRDIDIDVNGNKVSCRWYSPDNEQSSAIILYYHGGGFVVGDLESHDSICADICARTGLRLLSVDYRLSPEHLHPAAFEDSIAAFLWANRENGRPIILCGDSAGANLAAAVAHASRQLTSEGQRLIGQVLIYPALGGDTSVGSYQEHAHAPLLTTSDVHFYEQIRLAELPTIPDPTLAPLHDNDFSGLPRTLVFAAECDPLCDDGAVYCDCIVAAGGIASNTVEKGLVHGYLRARASVDRAERAFTNICDALWSLAKST